MSHESAKEGMEEDQQSAQQVKSRGSGRGNGKADDVGKSLTMDDAKKTKGGREM